MNQNRKLTMVSITIRKLDERLKQRLRVRAAQHGRSMEDEAREILKSVLSGSKPNRKNLASSIQKRFAPKGGLELALAPREPIREPDMMDS